MCLTPRATSHTMCSSVVADGSLPGDAAADGWELWGWDAHRRCSRPRADGNDRQGRARTQNDDTAALRPPLVLPVLSKTGPKSPPLGAAPSMKSECDGGPLAFEAGTGRTTLRLGVKRNSSPAIRAGLDHYTAAMVKR